VTLQEVAFAAGVSPATASRVLGREHAHLVRPEVQEQVRAAARRLRYLPDQNASTLRRGRSRTIALVMRASDLPITVEKLRAVEAAIWERGYDALLLHCGPGARAELQALKRLAGYRVDGVICSAEPAPELVRYLQHLSHEVPVVTLVPLPENATDCVTVDRSLGVYLAAGHLLRLGWRRLGAIMSLNLPRRLTAAASGIRPAPEDVHYSIRDRLEGLRRACREAGAPLDEDLVAYRDARAYAAGYEGILELWQRTSPPPDALICSNDQVAVGALRACQERGIRVPEDVALVGFDNLPEGAYARVPLTTLAQPIEEEARKAVELLFARMERPSATAEVTTVRLPPSLVIRESCGAGRRKPGRAAGEQAGSIDTEGRGGHP
jgi:LacI family transcriptional regulator